MITVKEEFLGSVKTKLAIKMAGSDAVVLWLAIKGYVSVTNSGGFVPTEAIRELEGCPKGWRKALKALTECGKLKEDGSRGAGLLDVVPHGYKLHDYEDHGTPVEVEAERRRKAREQKARRRAEIKRQTEAKLSTDSPQTSPGTETGQSGDIPPPAYTRERDAQPSPAQPSPKDLPPSPPAGGASEPVTAIRPKHVRNFEASFGPSSTEDEWAFARWAARFGKTEAVFDAKRASCLEDRRLEGMTRQDVDDALAGAEADDWCEGTSYKLSVIFGDRERFEAYRDAGRKLRSGSPETATRWILNADGTAVPG